MAVKIIEPTKLSIEQSHKKLNVCAYARVSTAHFEQEESFETQVKYYTEKIKANPNWNFIGVYADQAISGTTAKRPQFQQMIIDAEAGLIDLILVKNISRFSRNIADLLRYIKLLKANNVDLIFEEDHIQINDDKSNLILTLLGAVAQMESENTASRVRWALQEKMKNEQIVCNSAPLGYDIKTIDGVKQFVINEEEAKIVRFIFAEYLSGKGTFVIGNELRALNYTTKRGKLRWGVSSIRRILKNEKYTGTLIQGKTVITNTLDHTRKTNDGIARKYISENYHDAIISKDDFDKVQEIMAKRVTESNRGTTKGSNVSEFTGKLRCCYCGHNLVRKKIHTRTKYEKATWRCSDFVTHGKQACPQSKAIPEEDIKESFVSLLNRLLNDKNNVISLNEKLFESWIIEKEKGISDAEQQKSLETNLKKLLATKEQLLDYLLDGTISKDDYGSKVAAIEKQVDTIKEKLDIITSKANEVQREIKSIQEAKELISKNDVNAFNVDIFNKLVDHVIVGGERLENDELIEDPKLLRFILKPQFVLNSELLDDIDDVYILGNQ